MNASTLANAIVAAVSRTTYDAPVAPDFEARFLAAVDAGGATLGAYLDTNVPSLDREGGEVTTSDEARALRATDFYHIGTGRFRAALLLLLAYAGGGQDALDARLAQMTARERRAMAVNLLLAA